MDVMRLTRGPLLRALSLVLTFSLLLIAGCRPDDLPGPTPIPTDPPPTASPSPSPTLPPSPLPSLPPPEAATLRPVITATPPLADLSVIEGPAATPTRGPICFVAQQGDTLLDFARRAGYTSSYSVLPAIRELNGLPPNSNVIQVGREYCVPLPTATPTPMGGEMTMTAIAAEIALPTRAYSIVIYKVQEGDTSLGIQFKTGATLREICELNDPRDFNCAGCQLDKPIGEQGCRPFIRQGAELKVPGPPPTPTITPTLTGRETATPTPAFMMPRLISPHNGSSVSGQAQLLWLPVSVLEPGEFYLVMWSDITSGQTWQRATRETVLRLPPELEPTDGQPHTINWQVGVARESEDGASYVLISPMSLIYTFAWQSR